MTAIRFEQVEKRFGSVTVLSAFDLDIRSGEFFTFLGPSGCGKSTLLNLIAGIEQPDSGGLCFEGRRVEHLTPAERDVAMVFQSYALYPHMTVYENLAFPLRNRRVARAEIDSAVRRTAADLGLEPLLARKPRALSGGQRQRVALGRAIVRKPRVFLLDEPLSNLDARLRLEMREELKRLHATLGITTVYVTHDQEEAMALSDRIALLSEGRVQQCGSAEDLYRRPANLFVAGFIGSPPMNLLGGEWFADVPAVSARLGRKDPASVVVGLRPADVLVQSGEEAGALEARVQLIEPTGAERWVVARWRDRRIMGKADSESLAPGDTVYARIASETIHLFDKATGLALAP